MTCYQISQDGEPVALVANLALAERIIACQSPGFYQVEEIQVNGAVTRRKSRHPRQDAVEMTLRRRVRAVRGAAAWGRGS
jgi:hypothetical protein